MDFVMGVTIGMIIGTIASDELRAIWKKFWGMYKK